MFIRSCITLALWGLLVVSCSKSSHATDVVPGSVQPTHAVDRGATPSGSDVLAATWTMRQGSHCPL